MGLTDDDLERLATRRTIDITTTGRKTGLPRRVEIWWFYFEGRFIITGTPGRRDWLANLINDPRMTVHIDGRDIEATGTPILDYDFRRQVFTHPATSWYSSQEELDALVRMAPMIEVHLGA